MVFKDKILVFTAFQVMVLSFKGLNNKQKLLIIDLVIGLSKNHFLSEKGYKIPLINFR